MTYVPNTVGPAVAEAFRTRPRTASTARTTVRRRRSAKLAGGVRDAGPVTYTLLTIVVLVSLFPFYWIFVASSHTNAEMNAVQAPLLPGSILGSNIKAAASEANIPLALINSLIVSLCVAGGVVLTSSLGGFALSHLKMRGERFWLGGIIATMIVPLQLGIVPLFILTAHLHLVGNLVAVIVPYLATAFGVFYMRQYLLTALAPELLEAAKVDGASTWRSFWSIVVPIARPGMAVLGMLTFMTAWNEFFWPIVVLNASNPTVQVAISQLGQGYVHDQSIIMAGTLVCTIPVIVVFAILGKQIVSGIASGAVK
jgi:cellobiose transport system permease protein